MKPKNRYKSWEQIRDRLYSKEVRLRLIITDLEKPEESLRVQIRKPLTLAPDEWVLIGTWYPWDGRLFMNLSRTIRPCSDLDSAITRCIDFLEETNTL